MMLSLIRRWPPSDYVELQLRSDDGLRSVQKDLLRVSAVINADLQLILDVGIQTAEQRKDMVPWLLALFEPKASDQVQ